MGFIIEIAKSQEFLLTGLCLGFFKNVYMQVETYEASEIVNK